MSRATALAAIAGLFWPVEVALLGVALTAVGVDLFDGHVGALCGAALLGAPAVVWGLSRCLPSQWSENSRMAVGFVFVVPMFVLALFVFLIGYIAVGGYIPA